MTTTTADNSFRNDGIKLVLALVFVLAFLLTVGYILINYADEGPSVRYTPPAYQLTNSH